MLLLAQISCNSNRIPRHSGRISKSKCNAWDKYLVSKYHFGYVWIGSDTVQKLMRRVYKNEKCLIGTNCKIIRRIVYGGVLLPGKECHSSFIETIVKKFVELIWTTYGWAWERLVLSIERVMLSLTYERISSDEIMTGILSECEIINLRHNDT